MGMTQEEKQLLLKDLCARLPYGVKVLYWHPTSGGAERRIGELVNVDLRLNCAQLLFRIDKYYFESDSVNTSKPYLRPMSSMTEEERKYYIHLLNLAKSDRIVLSGLGTSGAIDIIDYLISHHFDYRGLIPMGLALEAPEGMYKTE